jgi:hypothetical protein
LCVIKKEGSAWSLANAFEDPVKPGRNGGFIAPSIESLDKYWGRLESIYGSDDLVCVAALGLEEELPLGSLKSALLTNQTDWLKKVLSALPKD